MSTLLQVFRAKPNPFGKDKTSGGVPKPEQLLGEWVDIKSIGTEGIRISTIELSDHLYHSDCQDTGKSQVYWHDTGTTGTLNAGQIIRVHTGKKSDEALMLDIDKGSVDWRSFANRGNFVLNNACGDVLTITWQDARGNRYSDAASYKPNVPEGAILVRSGQTLVTGIAASY